MRLFFDEDLGRGVAEALNAVHVATDWVGPWRTIQKGTADEAWIPIAGRQQWLVISANQAILHNETQRKLWIENNVGGVFLTSGRIRAIDLLRLVLKRLDWLEQIDGHPRPFAYVMTPTGRRRQVL